jgi:hypothetical protein
MPDLSNDNLPQHILADKQWISFIESAIQFSATCEAHMAQYIKSVFLRIAIIFVEELEGFLNGQRLLSEDLVLKLKRLKCIFGCSPFC